LTPEQVKKFDELEGKRGIAEQQPVTLFEK
jgi:hypothetical protein